MPTIELSTVAFYKGQVPQTLALRDCSLPLASPVPGALSAVYGNKSKPDAFIAARAHADRHGLDFTVIDFVVSIDHKPHASVMKPDELGSYDFFSLFRMSRPMREQVYAWICEALRRAGQSTEPIDDLKTEDAVTRYPSLIEFLLTTPECRHLKVIAYPAMTAISEQPLSVASVPFRHWSAIQEATCRLDPTVHVTLDPPVAQAAAKPAAAKRASVTKKPRAR